MICSFSFIVSWKFNLNLNFLGLGHLGSSLPLLKLAICFPLRKCWKAVKPDFSYVPYCRSEHENEIRKRQEEMAELKTALNKQTRAYNELKISKSSSAYTGDSSTSSVVAEKLSRIRELEEDILDLQASLDEVSHQLAESRNDCQNNLRTSNAKQKEIDELKEKVNIDSQMRQMRHKQVCPQSNQNHQLVKKNLLRASQNLIGISTNILIVIRQFMNLLFVKVVEQFIFSKIIANKLWFG